MPADAVQISYRLDMLERILPETGDMLISMRENPQMQIHTKTGYRDLVTAADIACENKILDFLKENFPEDGLIAEESGKTAQGSSGFTWVIDPIDGTVNYAHGIPLYAISAGLVYDGTPIGGLVYIPVLRDMYRGITGHGSFRNGKPMKVSEITEIRNAVIVTGFPYERSAIMEALLSGVRSVLSSATGIRRTGSATIDLCWTAEGRFDCYYETGLSPWDTAAAVVIAREAGAVVTDLKGALYDPFRSKGIAAASPALHPQLMELIADMRSLLYNL